MNAMRACQAIEAKANKVLLPYLLEQSDGRLVMTNKGTLARWLQESVGDVVLECNERMFGVELKAEQKHTGNLFLEVWSNRNLDNRASHAERGSNVGWMMKSKADLLLYYFIDADILYSLDLLSVQRWLFGYKKRMGAWCSGALREAVQTKSDQPNDTWGVLAPIDRLCDELRPGAFKKTRVRQREIDFAAAAVKVAS
jgi:hypothetical protein